MRAVGRAPSTVELRTYHVERVLRELDVGPWDLSAERLAEWLGSRPWSAETRRAYRASLTGFYRWARRAGLRDDDPTSELLPVKLTRALPRPTPDDAYRLAIACSTRRERLMLELAAHCGLRRGEIARVRPGDVVSDLDGWSLIVTGKGGHLRLVPLTDELASSIARAPGEWLFPSQRGEHLTAHYVGKLVSALLPAGWTCHTLRHRCATRAYAADRDLRAVQELLGHARPETTARYTQVPAGAVRAAVAAAAAA